MHAAIENIINGDLELSTTPEIEQFRSFYINHFLRKGYSSFRSEWKIAAPDLGIAGCVDFVAKDEKGRFVIMDSKRSKRLFAPIRFYQKAK